MPISVPTVVSKTQFFKLFLSLSAPVLCFVRVLQATEKSLHLRHMFFNFMNKVKGINYFKNDGVGSNQGVSK